jgi:hypothetical protein
VFKAIGGGGTDQRSQAEAALLAGYAAAWREMPGDRITQTMHGLSGGCPNGLAFAPNGREPRLLVPRQSRWAVVMAHLQKAG